MKAARTRPECGTRRGHSRHTQYGEYQCNACLEYATDRLTGSRIDRYRQDRLLIEVTNVGLVLISIQGTDPDLYAKLRADIGPAVSDACMTRARNDV